MNTQKPVVVCLFGFMAVGKFTIGQKLHEHTDINFCHNHLLNDFISSMFPRGTKARAELIEKYKIETLGRSMREGHSVITTEAYASNFISVNGTSSPQLIESISREVEREGGLFIGVHLLADNETILKRIPCASRKKYLKLIDPVEAEKLLISVGEQLPPDIKHLLTINTAEQDVDISVQQIIEFIKQKTT